MGGIQKVDFPERCEAGNPQSVWLCNIFREPPLTARSTGTKRDVIMRSAQFIAILSTRAGVSGSWVDEYIMPL